MSARYAVYWTPEPGHALWRAGCAWLGRDAEGRAAGPAAAGRAAPWLYGFHATLKPPMHLAEGIEAGRLHAALAALANEVSPFALPTLQVQTLSDFVALRLPQTPPALQALADRCVMQLDGLRRAADGAELARRQDGLDDEQRDLLMRWGYPHVLHRWRFHMTLSDALADPADRARIQQQAEAWFAPALAVPVDVESIALFEQAAAGAPLEFIARFALKG